MNRCARDIPSRFALSVTREGGELVIDIESRRRLRSLEIRAGDTLLREWAERETAALVTDSSTRVTSVAFGVASVDAAPLFAVLFGLAAEVEVEVDDGDGADVVTDGGVVDVVAGTTGRWTTVLGRSPSPMVAGTSVVSANVVGTTALAIELEVLVDSVITSVAVTSAVGSLPSRVCHSPTESVVSTPAVTKNQPRDRRRMSAPSADVSSISPPVVEDMPPFNPPGDEAARQERSATRWFDLDQMIEIAICDVFEHRNHVAPEPDPTQRKSSAALQTIRDVGQPGHRHGDRRRHGGIQRTVGTSANDVGE